MFVTHRIDIVTTDGLTLPLTALSTSHFHNIRSLGRLWYIDSKEQRQYGVKILWLNILLVDFILPRQFYSSEVSWLHPSHLPHQLQSHPLHAGAISMLKYISPMKRCSEKRWDMTWNLFICKFLDTYYSSALCLSNKTTKLYTTTKPHATINPQTSYYKGSAKKKGKQWTSGKLLTVHNNNILLTFDILLQTSIPPHNTQTPHNNQPPPESKTVRWGGRGK